MKRQGIDGVSRDHWKRYKWAEKLATGRVLDATCGTGYGSRMLHDSGLDVYGVDVSKDAIAFAEENYPGPEYWCCDLFGLPEGVFETVVCFETIEHLAEHEKAISLFHDVLSESGQLLISTPNEEKNPFDAGKFKDDEYPHLRHYTPGELDDLLWKGGFEIAGRNSQADKMSGLEMGTDGMFLVYGCIKCL